VGGSALSELASESSAPREFVSESSAPREFVSESSAPREFVSESSSEQGSFAVCVYCASIEGIPAHYLELAAEVGREIATRGWELVSGGGRAAMMGAVGAAARAGGARTWTAGYLRMHAKPVVLLDPDGHYTGLLDWVRGLGERGFVRPEALSRLVVATDVTTALDACWKPEET
jgi:predicted Rossmann-fold nucleotide-binding protein